MNDHGVPFLPTPSTVISIDEVFGVFDSLRSSGGYNLGSPLSSTTATIMPGACTNSDFFEQNSSNIATNKDIKDANALHALTIMRTAVCDFNRVWGVMEGDPEDFTLIVGRGSKKSKGRKCIDDESSVPSTTKKSSSSRRKRSSKDDGDDYGDESNDDEYYGKSVRQSSDVQSNRPKRTVRPSSSSSKNYAFEDNNLDELINDNDNESHEDELLDKGKKRVASSSSLTKKRAKSK